MKKKTFGALLLSVIVAIAATLSLTGCGSDTPTDNHAPDNSFEGSLSAQSYESVNAAAEAFLTEEINGKATEATFVSYEKSSDLTDEEIAELNLGEDFEYTVEQIDSAENGVVSYTDSVARTTVVVKTARLVVIKIGSVYWYYVPLFKNGDVLTNSYMDNILDYTKYRNVTETSVVKATASVAGYSVTTTITVTTKIAGDKVHLKQVKDLLGEKEITEYYFYFTPSSAVEYEYNQYTESWEIGHAISYNSVDEILEEAFKYDASYFVKTKSGFKMNSEKLTQYLNDVLSNVATAGCTINSASADYYVKDGRLDSARAKVTMTAKIEDTTVKTTSVATTKYSDFGTTEIEFPFEV